MKAGFIALVVLLAAAYTDAKPDKVVCYYGSWSTYRPGDGKFDVEDIPTNLCTHVIYSFVGLNVDGTVKILDSWSELDLKGISRFIALKQQNPSIKLLMAIGGWNAGSQIFSQITNNPATRAVMVNSIVDFVQKYNFDGFDLDWEYPAQRDGSSPSDRQSYIALIKELRTQFDKYGWLLTAAVAATKSYHYTSYDVPQMSKYLDFINLMTYDLHSADDRRTGQNAPLYASALDVSENDKQLNVDAAVNGWISSGASANKLVLGMGTYGKTFTLSSPSNCVVGAPVSGYGNEGTYSRQAGLMTHLEICLAIKSSGWNRVWDDTQKVPYICKGDQWIGYDDPQSIKIKTQYAIDKGLGGVMIWAVDYEDRANLCGGGKFPLLSAMNSVLKTGSSSTPTTAPVPTTKPGTVKPTVRPQPTSVPITKPPVIIGGEFKCSAAGYFRDPVNCSVFYRCVDNNGLFDQSRYSCQPGLLFDTVSSTCNWASAVHC